MIRPAKNIEMLSWVADGLGDLNDRVAFVGGAAIALYITDAAAPPVRPTDDVDCVVELASRTQYYRFEKELEKRGFKRPGLHEEGPVCRWKFGAVNVDVMPTDEKILGFQNRWYSSGLDHAAAYILPSGRGIRIFSLPYLLATKVEAFLGRGKGDFIASPDMEDIVALADGCREFLEEILKSPREVRDYLGKNFKKFVNSPRFIESLEGHVVEPGRAARAKEIFRGLEAGIINEDR